MCEKLFSLTVAPEITLRLRAEDDAEELFTLIKRNGDYLRTYLPWVDAVEKVDDSRRYLRDAQTAFAQNQSMDLGIWHRGAMVGAVGFHAFIRPINKTTIGYWLAEEFQGRGIVTQSVASLVKYGFNELGLTRMEIHCASENIKSRAIPERLGFRQEGQLRQNDTTKGRIIDTIIYGLLKTDHAAAALHGDK